MTPTSHTTSPAGAGRTGRDGGPAFVIVRGPEPEPGLAGLVDDIASRLSAHHSCLLVDAVPAADEPPVTEHITDFAQAHHARELIVVATPATMSRCVALANQLPRLVLGLVGLGAVPAPGSLSTTWPLQLADLTQDTRDGAEIQALATSVTGTKTVLWNGHPGGRTCLAQHLTQEIVAYADEVLRPAGALRRCAPSVPGTPKTVRLHDGITIAYTEYGQGDRVIITAQMGFPAEPNFPSLLAAEPVNARVLAVTLRGFRPSDTAPQDLGLGWLAQWADDVAELATILNIDRFLYTGGSHGGGVGWYLAARHPQRLSAYIGVVSGPHDRENDVSSSVARRSINDAWPEEAAVRHHVDRLVFGPLTHRRRQARRQQLIDGIVADYRGMLPAEARINQGKPWPQARTDDELAAVLATITVPTLLLSGMQDVIISPRAAFRASSSVPGAKSVLWQDEGHMTWEEAPDRLVEEVAQFYRELETTPAPPAGTAC